MYARASTPAYVSSPLPLGPTYTQRIDPHTRQCLTARSRAYAPEVVSLIPRANPYFRPLPAIIDAFAIALHPDNALGSMNILLTGEPATGKTESAAYVAALIGAPLVVVEFNAETRVDDLFGRHQVTHGTMVWCDGPITTAVRIGALCVLDEIALCPPAVAASLYGLLAGQALRLRTGEVVSRHPDFLCVATSNTWGGRDSAANRRRFNGSEAASAAMLSRFPLVVELPAPDVDHVTTILRARLRRAGTEGLAMADTLARLFVALRAKAQGDEATLRHAPTLRELIAALRVWETPRCTTAGLSMRTMEEVLGLTVLPAYSLEDRDEARAICQEFLPRTERTS